MNRSLVGLFILVLAAFICLWVQLPRMRGMYACLLARMAVMSAVAKLVLRACVCILEGMSRS